MEKERQIQVSCENQPQEKFETICGCVDFRRLQECKKSLEENLFILHPQLSLALLEIRAHCQSDYESKLMLAIEEGNTYTLDEFRDCHMGKMGLVSHPFVTLSYV